MEEKKYPCGSVEARLLSLIAFVNGVCLLTCSLLLLFKGGAAFIMLLDQREESECLLHRTPREYFYRGFYFTAIALYRTGFSYDVFTLKGSSGDFFRTVGCIEGTHSTK